MIGRLGSGWQTVLADLSLILFMVSISAVIRTPPAARAAPAQGEPVAVWRAATGGPDLAQWLAAQQGDTRARLTLVIHCPPADAAAAVAAALAAAGAAADDARIVVEPAPTQRLEAVLAYDRAPSARDLQSAAGMSPRQGASQ